MTRRHIYITENSNTQEIAWRIMSLARAGSGLSTEPGYDPVHYSDGARGIFDMIDDLAAYLWTALVEEDASVSADGKEANLDREIPY